MTQEDNISDHVVTGFDPDFLFKNGFELGSADLIQGGSFREVVGRTAALILHATNRDGQRAFDGATIILPPKIITKHTEESVFKDLVRGIKDLRGFEVNEQKITILRRFVRVVNSPTLEVSDMLSLLQEQSERSFIVVADANKYRDPSVDLPAVFGVTAVRIQEDRWVRHVASICKQLVPIVKKLRGYGLIHSSVAPAQRPENMELLTSVDDCYVATCHYESEPNELLSLHAQTWKSMVQQGRFFEVSAEVSSLKLPEGSRLLLLAQLLQGTGRDSEILEVLDQLRQHLSTLEAAATIQVASLAHRAGDDELASEILPIVLDGISDQLWLEEGLELTTHLRDNKRIDLFDARLTELLPHSVRLRENRDRRLLMNFQLAQTDESFLFTTAGYTNHHLVLQERLSADNPEYRAIIEEAHEAGQDWMELAVICCAVHAKNAGNPREAADAASFITSSELYGRQATQVLLSSIRLMILREFIPDDESDYYRNLFQAAFRFLAQHPDDGEVRLGLTTLLSVESCGSMGIPIVALTMLDLAQQGVNLARPIAQTNDNHVLTSGEAIEASMQNGFAWLSNLGAGEPGVTVIPRELLIAHPDDIVRTIARLVHYASAQVGKDVDLEFSKKLVLLACGICPHASDARNQDIQLVRHLACQMAMDGQLQQARNFAESILLMGQSNAYRRRLAWQAFGDVYHRCRNHTLALIGMACALAVETEVEKVDLWHEVYTIHRILRDLGLYELSRSFLPTMKTLLSDLGFDAENDPRYVCAVLGLRLMETKDSEVELLGEILAEINEACRKEGHDDQNRLFPLAMLLGQAILKVEAVGGNVQSAIRITMEKSLEIVGASMADMVRTVGTAKPTARDVLAILHGIEQAEYASDVASDYEILETVARRLLDVRPQDIPLPDESAFATELLADHTVALLSNAPTMTLEWPLKYSAELNQLGLDVAFLAVDTQGELKVTHVCDGVARMVDQPRFERSFKYRFLSWLENYPKDYGRIDRSEGNNIFYMTMEQLDIRLPSAEKLVLVAEPFLQQLTANLVVVQPEDGTFCYFAGSNAAIGIVPSLGWLSTTRGIKRNGRTAYKAWISAEASSAFEDISEVAYSVTDNQEGIEREPTLDIALNRLSGCFVDFGFEVDTGRRLPRNMQDAGLVVVTAHGGVSREGRFLRSIRDDGDLIETPSALASVLAGVELVILFVCSGGRIDKSPLSNSTTSLPKQLLNKGSRAVIASPWPLDVIVTYNWLEPFLKEWETGSTVLDATKIANDAVARKLGEVPQYSLAMRVYGDVLLTKPVDERAQSLEHIETKTVL